MTEKEVLNLIFPNMNKKEIDNFFLQHRPTDPVPDVIKQFLPMLKGMPPLA